MIGMGQPNNGNWHARDAESPADVQSMMLDASTTETRVEGLDDSWRASPWSSSMLEDREIVLMVSEDGNCFSINN